LYLPTVKNIIKIIDQINEMVGKTVSWLTLILVLVVCFEVLRRALFNTVSVWSFELQWHIFALIFLLGAGYALKYDRHVRVDLFYSKFSERDKAWVNFFGSILLLIPWLLVTIYFSFYYAMDAWYIGEGSPDPGGLPARYLIKFAVPFGLSLLLLQAISLTLSSLITLKESATDSSFKQ